MPFFGKRSIDPAAGLHHPEDPALPSIDEKARMTLQSVQEWQMRFNEQIEQVFYRQFREKLQSVSDLVSEMVVMIQREPEKLKAMPLLARYLGRIENQVTSYLDADLESSDEPDATLMRKRTEQMIDTVLVGFEEVKRDMQRSNYMDLRVGNKTLEQIFEEFAPFKDPTKK